jgi:hypothetical protein
VVGDMTLRYENVAFLGDTGQTMCIYTAEAGSPSEAALRLLASWTAEARPEHGPGPGPRQPDGRRPAQQPEANEAPARDAK